MFSPSSGGILVHLIAPVAAALQIVSRVLAGAVEDGLTYKIPMLIASATPTFSRVFICKVQIIFQGRRARTASIAAEIANHYPSATESACPSIHLGAH